MDLDTATVTLCEEKRSKLTAKLLPKKAARQLRARLAALLEKVRIGQENLETLGC